MDFLKYAHRDILINALYDMIKNEAQRIVDHRVLDSDSLEKIVVPEMRKVKETDDQGEHISILAALHARLKDMSLPGDGPEPQTDSGNDKPIVEPTYDDKDDDMSEVRAAISVIEELLEKVAYDLGKEGKHIAALKVENTAQEISKTI